MKKFDAIVIGAGHNGLTSAAFLAKSGLKVLVLERNPWIGGAAVSRKLHEDWVYSNCSYVCSLLRPEIFRGLDLARHGLQVVPYGGGVTFTRNGDMLGGYVDKDVKRLLSNFYEEFIALASGIELVGTASSFDYSEQTQFSRIGLLSRRLIQLLRGYKQRFRITYTRLADDQLCFQIDAFMGCASIIAATIKAVLDNLCEFDTELEMPTIEWSMVAIPDPSSLFVHERHMTNYPVWDCAIGSFGC